MNEQHNKEYRIVRLTLTNEKHDKEYRINLHPGSSLMSKDSADQILREKGLWSVDFSYGAIGSPLRLGTKTKQPVPYAEAKVTFDRLIAEKTGVPCSCCGAVYSVIVEATSPIPLEIDSKAVAQCAKGGVALHHTPSKPASVGGGFDSGIRNHHTFVPELYEPLPLASVPRFIANPKYGLQRKLDGHRVAVSWVPGDVAAFNRLGQRIPTPDHVARAMRDVGLRCGADSLMFDGEYLHSRYVAFDLLVWNTDSKGLPYLDRWGMLSRVCMDSDIRVADLYTMPEEKAEAFEEEHRRRGEGVVFKRLDGMYMPGRQGKNFKVKFWASATVRIAKKQKASAHHSFGTEVLRDGKWVYTGSVTCKGPMPEVGTYREVKYLNVDGVGGHLYQPEDLLARTDVTDADCQWSQLKLKQSREDMLR
jgi:hypothetical protein